MNTSVTTEYAPDNAIPLSLDMPGYFDRLAWFEQSHWWSLSQWRLASWWLDKALRGLRDLTALDVGCGTGYTLQRLRTRREIGRLIGVEPAAEAIGHARTRIANANNAAPIVFVQGGADKLPLADRSCDLTLCLDVLQHLDPGRDRIAAEEMYRVAKPGAVLLIRANATPMLSAPRPGYRMYALDDLTALFQNAGWSIEIATHANWLPALASELRGLFSARNSRRTGALESHSTGHPAGRGLPSRTPGRRMGLVTAIAHAEACWAGRLGRRLPHGHSTWILARR